MTAAISKTFFARPEGNSDWTQSSTGAAAGTLPWDRPALGLNSGDTKTLGCFHPNRIAQYQAVMTRVVEFSNVMSGEIPSGLHIAVDEAGGQWQGLGVWMQGVFFNRLPRRVLFYHQSSALAHRLSSREAKAFRTSAWDRPNCRAILDGVTPALNAARTAFTRPCDNGTAIWVGLSIKGRFFIRASEPATLAGSFPRRLASSVVTRRSRSNSWSLRYFMPLAKPLGRIDWREGRAVVTSDA